MSFIDMGITSATRRVVVVPLVRSVVVIHLLNIGQISAIDRVASESKIPIRVPADILRAAVRAKSMLMC